MRLLKQQTSNTGGHLTERRSGERVQGQWLSSRLEHRTILGAVRQLLFFPLRILQEVSRGFTYLRISVVGGDMMGTLQEIEDQGMNLQNRKDCDSTISSSGCWTTDPMGQKTQGL